MKHKLLFVFPFLLATIISQANTFTVTNTNDSGSGSLREAITYADGISGTHTIVFNIPTTDGGYNATTGVWTITPTSVMPYITRSNLTIDGTTQTTNQGNHNLYGPEIMLNGNHNVIDFGFYIANASYVTIKGFIVSDFLYGIQVFGPTAKYNLICGNYVGTNETGTDTLGNYIGIEMFGGTSYNTVGGIDSLTRNIVSGNEHIGIRALDSKYNIITANYVGIERTVTVAKGNYDGISIEGISKHNRVGGTTTGERNIVSGNVAYGIPIFGAGADSNLVIGNYVGTNKSGTASVPNTYGVLFDDGAKGNILGGYTAAERNILSGNSGYGVFIYNLGTNHNPVIGNYIGTDVSGSIAVPNANGIVVDGASDSHLIDQNVISGNLQQGIAIHITGCNHHVVIRNYIGTDKTGTLPLGNHGDGIRIAEGPVDNLIGGSPANANIIAYNHGNGVTVMNTGDIRNTISCNSIFQNDSLGIDLYPPGINSNDAGDGDSGPNMKMNYPVINGTVPLPPTQTIVSGTLDTPLPQYCMVELFKADVNGNGFAQGRTWLSSIMPDNSGNWSDTLGGLTWNDMLVATATDSSGNTSEFSMSVPAGIPMLLKDNVELFVYPNPTTTTLNLHYVLLEAGFVNISIYALDGKLQQVLCNKNQSSGSCDLAWNLHDTHRHPVAAGIYVCKMSINGSLAGNLKIVVE